MSATVSPTMTTDELLALPDDGVERWLVKGHLREKPSEFPGAAMTMRNRFHSDVLVLIGTAIRNWLRTQPKPRGKILGGEAGVRFPPPVDDAFGLDLVYLAHEVMSRQDKQSQLVVGLPTLCVEILSPNDTILQITEKVEAYASAGVAIVWVVDPYDQTVTVYVQGQRPVLYNTSHQIPEHPAMPGFSPHISEFFED